MVVLLLGGVTLVVLMSAMGMLSRGQIATVKQFGLWVAGIFGLLVAIGLFFSGRAATGIVLLGILGPLIWSFRAQRSGARAGQRRAAPPRAGRGGMSPDEAYQVLGLRPGAGRDAIQAAYVRLMQAAHPDRGGSDWLAARINQARDVLLG